MKRANERIIELFNQGINTSDIEDYIDSLESYEVSPKLQTAYLRKIWEIEEEHDVDDIVNYVWQLECAVEDYQDALYNATYENDNGVRNSDFI